MIELKNVSKFYTNNGVTSLGLKSINLKLNRNEIVAICGESGSGKSTLLNVITKIDTFDDGEIYIDNEETSYFDISDMDNFRKNKVGFIF
jgi:ABC-type lipoprotein export system ATPase subunit